MSGREIAVVRWGGLASAAALYGTTVVAEGAGGVRLTNRLMPSGTTIQEWQSVTDYAADRDIPALPLLQHGAAYRLEPALESDPPGAVLFEVRFFDRFGELLRAEVLHAPSYAFAYPAECHRYAIRLVNAGCDELRFTSFALREEGDRG